MMKYDIVIIGSGLGGLLCGAILSKYSYSVCVLEKHSVVGGNLQTFYRKDCCFNTGMHYMGSLDKEQILYKVFDYLGVIDRVEFEKIDSECSDKVFIGDKEYSIANGIENYKKRLISYFPDEKNQIENYLSKLDEIWNKTPILNLKKINFNDYSQNNHLENSLIEVIDSITNNQELKSVLLSNNGLYAGNPNKTPFYIHALIKKSFTQSSYRIKGGSDLLAKALKKIIEENKGNVLVNKEVIKINIDKFKAVSVTVSDNSTIYADSFISNIHPSQTNKMIDDGIFRKAYVNRIKNLENSIGSFVLYIVLKKKSYRHISSNIFFSKSKDIWAAVYKDNDEWPKAYMLYTNQDKNNQEYAESATIITFMKFEEVEKWRNTSVGKRGNDYLEFKKNKSQKLLDTVYLKFPDFKNCIDTVYSSSPLTYRDYTGIPQGSMYGIIKDYNNPLNSHLSTFTRIKNLNLTGQNIGVHGILGVTMNAILSCSSVIDINELLENIKNK